LTPLISFIKKKETTLANEKTKAENGIY